MYCLTHENGKRIAFPFTLSSDEIENLAANSTIGTTFTAVNVVTRHRLTVTGRKLS